MARFEPLQADAGWRICSLLKIVTDEQADGFFVLGDPGLESQPSRIAPFALAHRLPTMSLFKMVVEAGGLMS